MGQNRSSAVMAQRKEPKDSLDDFPTPPWATRALCEFLRGEGLLRPGMVAREPAANRGHMVKALADYFDQVIASDVSDYGAGFPIEDYLFPGDPAEDVDWTITNPPFRLAEEFIAKAMDTSRQGVAMLVRTSFIEGEGRYRRLFQHTPPHYVLQFTERALMLRGKLWRYRHINPETGKETTSATAYCWLIWDMTVDPGVTRLCWTGLCRDRLERPGDYPDSETVAI